MASEQLTLSSTADHVSNEIVIGLVAPIGTATDLVIQALNDSFEKHAFQCETISISDNFSKIRQYEECLKEAEGDYPDHTSSPFQRANLKIKIGDLLCEKNRDPALFARLACLLIQEYRMSMYKDELTIRNEEGEEISFKSVFKTALVIRSLKRIEEVELLRSTYGNSFFLIAIQSDHETRFESLKKDYGSESNASILIEIDAQESFVKFGQNTRDVFHVADAFLSVDSEEFSLGEQVDRIINLLFGAPHITPSKEELCMHQAFITSLRSGDLSRQVGAVIADSDGEIISTGSNEIPKAGGGQYWANEGSDKRDYTKGFDANAIKRNTLIINIGRGFESNDGKFQLLTEGEYERLVRKNDKNILLELQKYEKMTSKLPIRDITEWGRAVHAEMGAITNAARKGVSVSNSTLYCTTYPCHNCAKHIISSGIAEVLFIEPYPKSYAFQMYKDEIDKSSSNSDKSSFKKRKKVIFKPFVGIGPRRFVDLFSLSLGNGTPKRRNLKGVAVPAKPENQLRLQSNVWPFWYREILEANEIQVSEK